MKYKRPHRHNGVSHQPGDPFTGTVNTGRFLYHRGVLEPDGGPDDEATIQNVSKRHAWAFTEDEPAETDTPSTAWAKPSTEE